MEKLDFDGRCRELMMQWITSITYSMKINAVPHGCINPSRGLCQGDCLSAYLFLICAKGFLTLIKKKKKLATNPHNCRHLILYCLRLGPPFPNDNITLRHKVDLELNLAKSWLEELLMKEITYFWKRKATGNPKCVYAYICTRTLKACIRILKVCARI